MNRREILRTGSLGTLGLLATQTFQSARAQTRTAGTNERIRIGIVGFSDRLASSLLPAYKAVADQHHCEIVGDTLTAVFDYGPLDDPSSGFKVTYGSRFSNSAGGTKEVYYSNGGELNISNGKVSSNGGMSQQEGTAMKMPANQLEDYALKGVKPAITAANTGADELTVAHMQNWLECLRSRKEPNAPVEAGYQHSIACIMANAAARSGQRVTFDEKTQEVMAGDKIWHL